jgi:hypothetical protein
MSIEFPLVRCLIPYFKHPQWRKPQCSDERFRCHQNTEGKNKVCLPFGVPIIYVNIIQFFIFSNDDVNP